MHGESQTNDRGLAHACAVGMAVAAGLVRLIPHPANFTPVGALGLFGGARLRSGWAYVLPLGVMAVSDLLLWAIHGYQPFNLAVYTCFVLTVLWGRLLLRTGSAWRIGIVAVLINVQFFVVTNLDSWWTFSAPWMQADGTVMPPLYARDLSGLIASYVAALPFAGNQLAGDLFYTGLLFGLYAWLRSLAARPARNLCQQPAAARMP
jgi:hypothetical protein